MGHRERLSGRAQEPAEPRAARTAPPPHALLALQASAGNRAVTTQLQRFYEHPTWTRATPGFPANLKGEPMDPGWKENDRPPKGTLLIQEDDQW
jgi:hypothetical protein